VAVTHGPLHCPYSSYIVLGQPFLSRFLPKMLFSDHVERKQHFRPEAAEEWLELTSIMSYTIPGRARISPCRHAHEICRPYVSNNIGGNYRSTPIAYFCVPAAGTSHENPPVVVPGTRYPNTGTESEFSLKGFCRGYSCNSL
jgi:hypothetical protein